VEKREKEIDNFQSPQKGSRFRVAEEEERFRPSRNYGLKGEEQEKRQGPDEVKTQRARRAREMGT